MSEHVTETAAHGPSQQAVPTIETPPFPAGIPANWSVLALGTGAIALAVAALGALVDPAAFFRAYLPAFLFVLGVSLGSLALAMIGYLTSATWGRVLAPVFDAAMAVLPVVAVLFLPLLVPVLLGNNWLYPWADPVLFQASPVQVKKALYLNGPFFAVRAAVYFSVWIGVAYILQSRVRTAARTGELEDDRRMRGFSAVGLGLYGLTITFAAIDWAMSLEPEWFSAIYGVILATGEILSAFSFAVLATTLVLLHSGRQAPQRLLRDFGNLLLAFTMVWAYMAFSQFLIIYSGNLKEEIPWYLRRSEHGWQYVIGVVVLFQFALPFFLLLSSDVKTDARKLARVAALAFGMRLLDLIWMVMPAYEGDHVHQWWQLPLTVLGLGGLWAGMFLRSFATATFNLHPFPAEEDAHA